MMYPPALSAGVLLLSLGIVPSVLGFSLASRQDRPSTSTNRTGFRDRQVTRSEVISRASRTRPKRATISAGVVPSCINGQSFVLQLADSGQTDVDGTYVQEITGDYTTLNTGALLSGAQVFTFGDDGAGACALLDSDEYAMVVAANPGQMIINDANPDDPPPAATPYCYVESYDGTQYLACTDELNQVSGGNGYFSICPSSTVGGADYLYFGNPGPTSEGGTTCYIVDVVVIDAF